MWELARLTGPQETSCCFNPFKTAQLWEKQSEEETHSETDVYYKSTTSVLWFQLETVPVHDLSFTSSCWNLETFYCFRVDVS